MARPTETARILGAMAVVYFIALLLDLYILPGHSFVAVVYAIPILIAAQGLSLTAVEATAAISLALDISTSLLKGESITVWPYEVISLLIISYVSILLSIELRQASKRAMEAEEARRRLQEFTGMVAHDLRGPLTTVLGYAQMISRGQQQLSPEASEKMIYAIQKETHRMNRLISDMLDASQIGAGRFTIQREPMDLVSLARDIVQQQQATTTKHHIILEAPKSLEGVWDADRIAQVLTNLLSNAIKYSPEGGYIWVNLSQVDGNATVRVTDQGIGVAPDDIPLLFEPFSRLYREQPAKGTGLGLYITKAIVEAHGGRIQVESAGPGKGSSFILTLPLSGPPPSSRFTPPRKRSP